MDQKEFLLKLEEVKKNDIKAEPDVLKRIIHEMTYNYLQAKYVKQ